MTPTQRTIAAIRKLRSLYSQQGVVPLACLDMLIAELETEADASLTGQFHEEDRALSPNLHGYHQGLATP